MASASGRVNRDAVFSRDSLSPSLFAAFGLVDRNGNNTMERTKRVRFAQKVGLALLGMRAFTNALAVRPV